MDRNVIFVAVVCFILIIKDVSSQTGIGSKCSSPDQYPGTCVELESCENIRKLRFLSEQSHNQRLYVTLSNCGFKKSTPLVCCTESPYPDRFLSELNSEQLIFYPTTSTNYVSTQQYTTTSTSYKTQRTTSSPTIYSTQHQSISSFSTTQRPTSFSKLAKQRSLNCSGIVDNRIFGGEETRIDELPFTAVIAYTRDRGSQQGFFCGGALISERSVLTAAHCTHEKILEKKGWKLRGVRLGEWNMETNPDCETTYSGEPICAPPIIDLSIAQTIVHERFVPFDANLENDIAILRLHRDIEFNAFVKPICLPLPSNVVRDFTTIPLIVAGFGKTENSENSKFKLKTEIRGITNSDCQALHYSEGVKITENHLCALGEAGKDSCNGDSGQPLIYVNSRKLPARLELVGIVSYGPTPCGQELKPGVYTRTSNYLKWIYDNME